MNLLIKKFTLLMLCFTFFFVVGKPVFKALTVSFKEKLISNNSQDNLEISKELAAENNSEKNDYEESQDQFVNHLGANPIFALLTVSTINHDHLLIKQLSPDVPLSPPNS
jgi:hypothetical protein